MTTITIKTFFGKDIRRFSVQKQVLVEELREIIGSLYNIQKPHFKYVDSEGDLITVSTQREWEEAVRIVENQISNLPLKVFVFIDESLENSLQKSSMSTSSSLSLSSTGEESLFVPIIGSDSPIPTEELEKIQKDFENLSKSGNENEIENKNENSSSNNQHISNVTKQVLQTSIATSLNLTQTAKDVSNFIRNLELTSYHFENPSSNASEPKLFSAPKAFHEANLLAQETIDSCRLLSEKIAQQCIEFTAQIRHQVLEQSSQTMSKTPALENCSDDIDNIHKLGDKLITSTRDECHKISEDTRRRLDNL